MASAVATKSSLPWSRRTTATKLASTEIRRRFEQIELATVSSLRALEMDIDGDAGVPSATVLKKARAALR